MNTMVNNKRFLAHYVEGAVAKKKKLVQSDLFGEK